MGNFPISHRASSVKPSMRLSISRTTLLDYDAESELKTDVMYGTTNTVKECRWFDHLLGVFCISRGPKFASVPKSMSVGSQERNNREAHLDSAWVLPVYVLSAERDEYRHRIPKEAKCTIDTGNLQGNIVSRTFLFNVLGYSEADFQKLTTGEENGGTGITGHKLIPDGGINLTWYHNNSTRVFRDMRFLISEHPMYDLIIGAHSIQENNILDVPNLMTTPAEGIVLSKSLLKNSPRNPKLKSLEVDMNKEKQKRDNFQIREEWKKIDPLMPKEEQDKLLREKTAIFEAKKETFHDACRQEYEVLIQDATDQNRQKDKEALEKEYKKWAWFKIQIQEPQHPEEDPKKK